MGLSLTHCSGSVMDLLRIPDLDVDTICSALTEVLNGLFEMTLASGSRNFAAAEHAPEDPAPSLGDPRATSLLCIPSPCIFSRWVPNSVSFPCPLEKDPNWLLKHVPQFFFLPSESPPVPIPTRCQLTHTHKPLLEVLSGPPFPPPSNSSLSPPH